MLQWIMHSRSWRYMSWLRRARFLSLRIGPRLRQPGRDPFRGELDHPADGNRVSQRIKVEGWAYSEGSSVAYVEVFLDAISLGHLRYGLPRLDAAAYPSRAPIRCGYEGTLSVDESLAGRRRLTVRVVDTQGRIKDYERAVEVVMSHRRAEAETPPVSCGPAFAPSPAPAPQQDSLPLGKKTLEVVAGAALESFLSSDSAITFPQHDSPETSIVIVLYNRAELTLQCLLSVLNNHRAPYEVIIINNASTDETRQMLARVRGARVVHNQTNVHYLRACNQAARLARGRNLLLLNNDAQLLGDGIAAAAQTLDSSPDIGAVGGRIILPDGSLQEAGSIIWRDGSCQGYGRGASPSAPEVMFLRDVDYCSAVFFLTRRDLFLDLGGFDESLVPAYYEDADYCASLWRKGLRVVYDPRVSVLHYESASSDSPRSALDLQAQNRRAFVRKHREWLRSRHPASPAGVLQARSQRRDGQKRILYLDDRVPHSDIGCGFPRSNRVITEIARIGHAVTCYPLNARHESWHEVYRDLPREVEVMQGRGLPGLAEFLSERAGYYDIIYVSRPHNLAQLQALLLRQPNICGDAKVIYDSEAIVSHREIERRRVSGKSVSEYEHEDSVEREMRLAQGCHSIVSVSELDGREFTRRGFRNVHTMGHSLDAAPTP
ncbi:MAG TPA: glycosyltransferase family 2 protein, partial [Pyrinomonadaceae bacterium]